jgi:hypothetical protein
MAQDLQLHQEQVVSVFLGSGVSPPQTEAHNQESGLRNSAIADSGNAQQETGKFSHRGWKPYEVLDRAT